MTVKLRFLPPTLNLDPLELFSFRLFNMVDFEVNSTREVFKNDLIVGWSGFAAGISNFIKGLGFNKTLQTLVEVL